MNWLRSILMEGEGGAGGSNGGGTPPPASTTLLGTEGGGTPPPAFTPSYEGVLQPDGNFAEGWTGKAFGPDYADGPLARVKSLGEMDKVLRDNIAAARGKGLEYPGEKSTPEQIAAFRKLTGAPEKAELYGSLRPETIPEGLWDMASEKKLQEVAHKHHLPPAAIKDIVGLYAESLDGAVKANEAELQVIRAAGLQQLHAEFGKEFDSKMHLAKSFALTIGLKETDPIFNSPAAVVAMARGAALVSEDKLINGATQGLSATPKAQANAIMTDATNPLYKKYQEGDKDTVSLVNNLLVQGVS